MKEIYFFDQNRLKPNPCMGEENIHPHIDCGTLTTGLQLEDRFHNHGSGYKIGVKNVYSSQKCVIFFFEYKIII